MKKPQIKIMSEELLPKRGDYLNSQQLVAESKKQNTPLSRKTLHNYIRDKILPKASHVSNEALFHKQFYLAEIKGIHTLRSIFHVKYDDLIKLAANKYANLYEITNTTNSILDYFHGINIGKASRRPLLVNISNDEFLQKVAAAFLDEMKKGADFNKIDIKKFIQEIMDKG